jgi:hypothetical protein
MDVDELVCRYPRLYHLASSDAWESIKTHGLLSTASLAVRFGVPPTQYRELTTQHRPKSTVLHHPTFGRGVPALVLTLNTRSLVTTHRASVRLSRLNSGAVRHINHRRGSTTFKTLDAFVYSANNQVAELAVIGSVPDIQAHVLRVERRVGGRVTPLDL